MPLAADALHARRVVVKIGSSLLVDEDGQVREAWLDGLAADVAALVARGQQPIIVTPRAIALGPHQLRLKPRPQRPAEKETPPPRPPSAPSPAPPTPPGRAAAPA